MKSPHILFFLDYYLPHQGGAEKVFSRIIGGLLDAGVPCTIITTKHDPALPNKQHHENLTIIRKGQTRYSIWRHGLRQGIRLLIHNKSITHIHTTTYAAALPAWIVAALFRLPVSITIHELFGPGRKAITKRAYLYRIYERIICLLPRDYCISVSHYTKSCIQKRYAPKKNVTVIHNGVDPIFTNTTHQPTTTHPYAFYFGHCGYSKGIDAYIDALPLLHQTFPNITFVYNILDSKNTNDTIQRLTTLQQTIPIQIHTGLSQKVLTTMIAGAQLVVVPSRSEGFGLAAAESCAVGTPLLTTSNGSLPEVVSGKSYCMNDLSPSSFKNGFKTLLGGKSPILPKKSFTRQKTIDRYYLTIKSTT